MDWHIELPFNRESLLTLRAYDRIWLSGTLLVGRDQANKRLVQIITNGGMLPVSLTGQLLYYMGPAATPPQMAIGSCGPTTSARMDAYVPALMDHGLAATMGKGPRNQTVVESIVRHKGIYLAAFGGCGALYAKKVVVAEIIAFEDLGPEALYRLKVEEFPAIVAIDSLGSSVY
ncbi:MAG: FumA C-terminus/TtdB family hydratase beta subunit [Sphaerochaetaceae bacterium]|jgi:fumarate hydratase subunit beta|nr:FumA C-terminus/TtdB family hydratase beta subunit [Sphaerochaetaceae bacterium]NLO60909.1 TRZ/ATZ family protein [Spirochaetales bacterium]MDD2405350.1 FumA C-terminus/TtdB family hydratase beta subunit [Sphaerochaetaceae bacterium]MDD3670290.1 FumA C-terminus/TtdB family hydratase beta subunit [Sphaerochaetaceae bacterium]MDD4258288.1 FumA C-terminus/TtdB family hydratase beta subunit [Sphaerochaetaceae bacterium]